MAAESLPFFGTLSSWELEAWYEDLQEVLSSDENGGTYVSPPGNEEVRMLCLKLRGLLILPSQLIAPTFLHSLEGRIKNLHHSWPRLSGLADWGARTSRGHEHLSESSLSRFQSELPGSGGRRRPQNTQETKTGWPVPSPGWKETHEGQRTGERKESGTASWREWTAQAGNRAPDQGSGSNSPSSNWSHGQPAPSMNTWDHHFPLGHYQPFPEVATDHLLTTTNDVTLNTVSTVGGKPGIDNMYIEIVHLFISVHIH